MSDKGSVSDLEYYESGQDKQDLYDELMRVRQENERLKGEVNVLWSALRLAKPFIDTMADWAARGSYEARDAIDRALGEKK